MYECDKHYSLLWMSDGDEEKSLFWTRLQASLLRHYKSILLAPHAGDMLGCKCFSIKNILAYYLTHKNLWVGWKAHLPNLGSAENLGIWQAL
jgi:hypothetical protein